MRSAIEVDLRGQHRNLLGPTRAIALLALALSAAGCAFGYGRYDYSREPDPRREEYIIGPSDVLSVNVWRDPELSREVKVRPDGTITLPLVGDVRAAGRRPSEIKQEVTQKLSAFQRPETLQVTVSVAEARSYSFTISGNAERPGRYSADQYITVLEALSLAGGPNRYAQTRRMAIVRCDESGNTRQIPIDYDTLKTGDRMDQNIVVLRGDTILIP
jgi:polysaccharide export outer membrane protein